MDQKLLGAILAIAMLSSVVPAIGAQAAAEEDDDYATTTAAAAAAAPRLFDQATKHFQMGEYDQAISVYDQILEMAPENISTLKMKGIAQSNLGHHERSLEQFFRILQYRPDDIHALAGMGVGLGYLGEYQEAKKYFEAALKLKPESVVLQNYNRYVENVIAKYPYTPTEKPRQMLPPAEAAADIPPWVRAVAGWWADGMITDGEFASAAGFLVSNGIIKIPNAATAAAAHDDAADAATAAAAAASATTTTATTTTAATATKPPPPAALHDIPPWVRTGAAMWADGTAGKDGFVSGLLHLIESGTIQASIQETEREEKTQQQKDDEFSFFKTYLRKISKNVADEKRYIEFPNPSQDVIKKFLRDYAKWNFEDEAKRASTQFPDPTFTASGDVTVLHYAVYVNEQPSGLPLDHVGTLRESIAFWESQQLLIDGQKARVDFEFTATKSDANVWVTWVVRDLGDGVLGHAHLGKGIVEVTLGDYRCDGSFQLYDVGSVEQIMRHELGHSIGLTHADDRGDIMYPSYTPRYAYCLLA